MSEQLIDLGRDLSQYSDAELMEKVRELRRSRCMKKETSNKPADRPAKKTKKADTALSLLVGLSDADRQNFISMLSK